MSKQESPRYAIVKRYYNKGFWTEEMVRNAVKQKWITEDELQQIIAPAEEPAESVPNDDLK